MDRKYYYQVYLEVSLKNAEKVFGFVNISHIPYSEFEKIFKSQMEDEKTVFDNGVGYYITPELFQIYKDYLMQEIPFTFDFRLFDYAVGISSVKIEEYKKDYYEELPSY